jgi:hypothetical protein
VQLQQLIGILYCKGSILLVLYVVKAAACWNYMLPQQQLIDTYVAKAAAYTHINLFEDKKFVPIKWIFLPINQP